MDGRGELTMMTPIDAVRFHSGFGDADFWLRGEGREWFSKEKRQEIHEEHLAPARGAMLGLVLGGLMWVGLIAAFRAIVGV